MKLWAEYNRSWSEKLLQKACGEEIPEDVPAVDYLFKVDNYRNPEMKWRFVRGHYHLIERKINNQDWEVIHIKQIPTTTTEIPDTSFIDFSINILRWQGIVSYRVVNQIYDECSETSNIISWDTRPQIESMNN